MNLLLNFIIKLLTCSLECILCHKPCLVQCNSRLIYGQNRCTYLICTDSKVRIMNGINTHLRLIYEIEEKERKTIIINSATIRMRLLYILRSCYKKCNALCVLRNEFYWPYRLNVTGFFFVVWIFFSSSLTDFKNI